MSACIVSIEFSLENEVNEDNCPESWPDSKFLSSLLILRLISTGELYYLQFLYTKSLRIVHNTWNKYINIWPTVHSSYKVIRYLL